MFGVNVAVVFGFTLLLLGSLGTVKAACAWCNCSVSILIVVGDDLGPQTFVMWSWQFRMVLWIPHSGHVGVVTSWRY